MCFLIYVIRCVPASQHVLYFHIPQFIQLRVVICFIGIPHINIYVLYNTTRALTCVSIAMEFIPLPNKSRSPNASIKNYNNSIR
jgi:hypothetical protein